MGVGGAATGLDAVVLSPALPNGCQTARTVSWPLLHLWFLVEHWLFPLSQATLSSACNCANPAPLAEPSLIAMSIEPDLPQDWLVDILNERKLAQNTGFVVARNKCGERCAWACDRHACLLPTTSAFPLSRLPVCQQGCSSHLRAWCADRWLPVASLQASHAGDTDAVAQLHTR